MEEPKEDWQIQQYRSGENEGRLTWILNKGLELGKKILFTGFVISSAPLVLPPLLVISAIGFFVSLPSGVFLASYACSEKLMSKLLPLPEYQEQLGEEEEAEDVHRGMKRKIESVGENGDEKLERVKREEVLGDRDAPVEENGYEEDVGEDLDVEKEKEDVVVNKEEAQPLVDKSTGKEESVVVQTVVLDVTEGGEENGEAKIEVTTVVVEEGVGGQERENRVSEEEMKKETRSTQEVPTSKGDQSGAVAAELPVSHGAKESKDAGVSSGKEVQTTPSTEVVISEAKIWEQIEGLRKIVGYRATLQKTTIEELKALYIFTGVEPPASFKDPSDLAEVDNKLQFLKSIVGVN